MIFKDWFKDYFNAYCVDVITYVKQQDYMYIYKKHYYPIADMELAEIKPIDIQRCIKTTKGYCSQRQRDTFFLLRRVLQEALYNGYIDKNPAEYIKPPKREKKFADTFDKQQIEWLFDSDTSLSRMFLLELWTGLRRGELLALTWDNIDIDRKTIRVCQTLVRTANGDEIINTTKSRCERLVPLSDNALEILSRIRANDSTEGFLFAKDGKPISLRNYNRLYHKYFKQQQDKHPDLKYLSPHKLRHSFATYMLYCGADIETLRALLGHADISTTQRCIHSNFQQMQSAVQKLHFV